LAGTNAPAGSCRVRSATNPAERLK
jgi:hypothetical protein